MMLLDVFWLGGNGSMDGGQGAFQRVFFINELLNFALTKASIMQGDNLRSLIGIELSWLRISRYLAEYREVTRATFPVSPPPTQSIDISSEPPLTTAIASFWACFARFIVLMAGQIQTSHFPKCR